MATGNLNQSQAIQYKLCYPSLLGECDVFGYKKILVKQKSCVSVINGRELQISKWVYTFVSKIKYLDKRKSDNRACSLREPDDL